MSTLRVTRLRKPPTANLDGTAPRIGAGTHALGHGLLTEFLDELLLELVPHDRHVDNHGKQVDIHDQHERQRQCRPLVGDDHGSDQDYERDRDEELAQIEAGIDVVTDVDAPRQTFRLRHVVDVATLHGIVFGVLTFADAGLGRLTAGVAILGDQRTEILRLGVLALRGRTALAGGRLCNLALDVLLRRFFLLL